MKLKYILLLPLAMLMLISCKEDEAKISVTNKVGNVRLDNISFGDISLGLYKLLPGESTGDKIISEKMNNVNFPMAAQLQFYMVSGENRVFLKTKEQYSLNVDQHLQIVIEEDTKLINPLTNTEKTVSILMEEINDNN